MEHKIVSLIASATEIVSALGYQEQLVGRSHECDYPPEIQKLPPCSEPRIDVSASSGEIDRQVRETVQEVLSVYSVFQNELERLQPSIIITQSQCDVCAVNLRDVQAAVKEMIGSKPHVVSLEPMRLDDIWTDINRVALALSDPGSGKRLVSSLQARLQDLQRQSSSLKNRPTIFCLEWIDPIMVAGNWVPELVEIAGGIPVLSQAGQHSPYVSWEDLLEVDPDVIAIMPCGFGIKRTMQEMNLLTDHPDWQKLKAVQEDQVYLTDGNHYFNRPGPRVVESVEILIEILNSKSESFSAIDEQTSLRWRRY